MDKHDIPGRFEEPTYSGLGDTDRQPSRQGNGAGDGPATDGKPVPRHNPYRDVDWEEDPPRTKPSIEDVEPRRRFQLEGASDGEVCSAHKQMLKQLSCETYDFAMDCFETARGISDRVAGRSRKLAMACRLAGLTAQLIAAVDKHNEEG
ncbi:hypothetical protein RXV95_11845 [Novosphingobium sp. ZN18A2]|uniref:hypothetical protein n=1 Tax=Novosphingobium sp. ZN18A2 TaxID=3079861 RepID=UPI0030CF7509